MDDILTFNKENFGNLKRLYKEAVKENRESFTFQEKEILTSYAKYLIEYLEKKF